MLPSATVNLETGAAVPTPTLPVLVLQMWFVPQVVHCCAWASLAVQRDGEQQGGGRHDVRAGQEAARQRVVASAHVVSFRCASFTVCLLLEAELVVRSGRA